MPKEKVLREMWDMAQRSPEHLCYRCACGYYIALTNDILMTSVDANACELYYKTWESDIPVAVGEGGNTRAHLNGFRTEDNGGGYWITECPYFKSLWKRRKP